MYYSMIGILALLLLIIENRNALATSGPFSATPSHITYRRFLMIVAVYYVLDVLWGVFEQLKLAQALFIDTSFYFVAMAVGVLFWTQYTVAYLEEKNVFAKILVYSGRAFAVTGSERDRAHKIITRDALTGVGNNYAFADAERELSEQIKNGETPQFSVILFDINDLKTINDTKGRAAGDACVKKVCASICNTFAHSRVFRIDSDEFVVISSGDDYENIDKLPNLNYLHEFGEEALHAGVDSFLAKPIFAPGVIDEFTRHAVRGAGVGGESKRADLSGRHILLAEDFIINAEIVKELMSLRGAQVDHAENGRIAVEAFEKSAPGYYDAVLMDVRMPEMDGLEATGAIRALARPDAQTVPIIAMTAPF